MFIMITPNTKVIHLSEIIIAKQICEQEATVLVFTLDVILAIVKILGSWKSTKVLS